MELSPDLSQLLQLFHSHRVDCIVVGAHALAFYGAPRFTGDLDLLVSPSEDNGERIVLALEAFGMGGLGIRARDFTVNDQVIQLGNPPSRVDLLTGISGVTFAEATESAVDGTLGGIPVRYLGRDTLIANKRATGRLKDLADIEALGELGE